MKKNNIKILFVTLLLTVLFFVPTDFSFGQTKSKPKTSKKSAKIVKKDTKSKDSPTVAPVPEEAPIKKNERLGEASAASPQDGKANNRNNATSGTNKVTNIANLNLFSYEFLQPNFLISNIFISHDEKGRGNITFKQKDADFEINDPLEVSPAMLEKIKNLWTELNFLDSAENYQSEKQFPHLGTMRLKRQIGEKQRVAEFNWTENKAAKSLIDEYRKLGEQYIWIFDINVARENQPLETPKLVERIESLISRNAISDKNQLLPFLRELQTDERLPLMARNRLEKIIKNIEKSK